MKNSTQKISALCARQLNSIFNLSNEDKEDLLQEIWIHLFCKFGENRSASAKEMHRAGFRKGLNFLRDLLKIQKREISFNHYESIDEEFENDLINRIGIEQELENLPYHLTQLGFLRETGLGIEKLGKCCGVSTRTIIRWNEELRKILEEKNLEDENKSQTTRTKSKHERKDKRSQHSSISCDSRRNTRGSYFNA